METIMAGDKQYLDSLYTRPTKRKNLINLIR